MKVPCRSPCGPGAVISSPVRAAPVQLDARAMAASAAVVIRMSVTFRLRRAAALHRLCRRNSYSALRQRLAQEHFQLGVDRPKLLRRQPLDRRMERRVEPESKGLLGGLRHDALEMPTGK